MTAKLITAAALALALPLALAVASPSIAAPAAATTVTVKGHIMSPTGRAIPAVTESVYSTVDGHHVVSRARASRTGRYEIKTHESDWAYYKDSATLASAAALVVGPKGGVIRGLTVDLSSK